MQKRVSVLGLIMAVVVMPVRSELGQCIDPSKFVDQIPSILSKPMTGAFLFLGGGMSFLANDVSERKFDDKGELITDRSVESDPLLGDVAYAAAQGTFFAAGNQWFLEDNDMNVRTGITNSLVSAAALFLTDWVTRSNVMKSCNRSNPLLKCIPWTIKMDGPVFKAIICLAATRTFNRLMPTMPAVQVQS